MMFAGPAAPLLSRSSSSTESELSSSPVKDSAKVIAPTKKTLKRQPIVRVSSMPEETLRLLDPKDRLGLSRKESCRRAQLKHQDDHSASNHMVCSVCWYVSGTKVMACTAFELPNQEGFRIWSLDRGRIEPDADLVDQTQVPTKYVHKHGTLLPEDRHKPRAEAHAVSSPYCTTI